MAMAIETFRGVAHPWLCDAFGHLNTRHQMAMFDDAGFHFLHAIGPTAAAMSAERKGWADVRLEVDLKDEVPFGSLVVIRSHLIKVGRTSLTYAHAMHSADDDRLHTSMQITTVHFDLELRKAAPLPAVVLEKAQRFLAE
ncbi:MAG: acyl-CoA thioesterase [Pseudomonadota bacterium]